jgi:hypothetical protein
MCSASLSCSGPTQSLGRLWNFIYFRAPHVFTSKQCLTSGVTRISICLNRAIEAGLVPNPNNDHIHTEAFARPSPFCNSYSFSTLATV